MTILSLFIHIESGMPPRANIQGDLRFDLDLSQTKLGPPLGQSQSFITYPIFMLLSFQLTAEPL
jgi:hypothetical protein